MKHLYIIKAGSTFAATAAKFGDFEEMTRRGLKVAREKVKVVKASQGENLPTPDSCYGAVITGAHCMVTDNLPWSLTIEKWVKAMVAAEVPLLGVCYGHQLLGRAMGGKVGYHPQGKEVGTFEVRLLPAAKEDPLIGTLPQKFPVHATHAQSVLKLPPGATHLAENDFERHHAMRIGRCAWGVQFHPEYDCNIERDYIEAQAKALAKTGRDVDKLLANLRETPEAASILRKFARLALTW
jgi:GMP synthase (glutamine-hydrolysing)